MSSVRNKNTRPEVLVRRLLHRRGFRFRLHRRDLPGAPDIVLPRYRAVIFVHGCFWHGHDCRKGRRPQSNVEFWNAKLDRNEDRDREARERLVALGWRVFTVWECELTEPDRVAADLETALRGESALRRAGGGRTIREAPQGGLS